MQKKVKQNMDHTREMLKELDEAVRHVVEYADYNKDEGKTLGTAAFKVMWGAVPGDPPGLPV